MASSTSPSSAPVPRLAVLLLAVALAGFGLCAFYTLRLNPELSYFVAASQVQSSWADKMTREHGAKLVAYGGSSCEFGIDAERLLNVHRLPAVNMGRGAAMGATVLTLGALQYTRPGDTLVVALEPVLLNESLEPSPLGVQFSVVTGHPEWVTRPAIGTNSLSWPSVLLSLRPGGYHTLTMLAKLATGSQPFRYDVRDIRPGGISRTPLRLPITGPARHTGVLSEDARHLLTALREWTREHDVRVAYTLPWSFTPTDAATAYRRFNARFLMAVAEILPVLRDPRLGAYEVREHFADTEFHLTPEGAALRTDELADMVANWRVWNPEELTHVADAPDGASPLTTSMQ
jgi:hypothetical protein